VGFLETAAGITGEPKTAALAGFGASATLGGTALERGASGKEMVFILGSPCPHAAATVADW
jgi:hypothetical protein